MGGGASAAPAPVEREGDEVAVHVERLSDVRCTASELYVELYVEHRPRDGDGACELSALLDAATVDPRDRCATGRVTFLDGALGAKRVPLYSEEKLPRM